MYLPTELGDEVSYEGGGTLMWSEREIKKLTALGDAVDVGYRTYRIPQHHARTVEAAMAIIGAYRRFAEKIGFSCVFRGQTRDYFNTVQVLLVLPGILRVNRLYQKYISNHRGFSNLLNPWLSVLEDLGIETGTGVDVDGTLRLRNQGAMAGRALVGHPVALLRANPVVAAILQHYGFPTDHLDASTDPQIALWFALHESRTTRRRISFLPLPPRARVKRGKVRSPVDTADVPTLHIYLQPAFSVEDLAEDYVLVDLSHYKSLTARAKRPTCQSAVSLPCGGFTVGRPSLRMLPIFGIKSPTLRWPAAIVKIYFPFAALGRDDLAAENLFPKDEPLYRRLLEVKAPYLAIYA